MTDHIQNYLEAKRTALAALAKVCVGFDSKVFFAEYQQVVASIIRHTPRSESPAFKVKQLALDIIKAFNDRIHYTMILTVLTQQILKDPWAYLAKMDAAMVLTGPLEEVEGVTQLLGLNLGSDR